MQTFTVALTLAALANAFPSDHVRRGHSHHRREAAAAPDYDLSKVDWSKIDWASVFGQKVFILGEILFTNLLGGRNSSSSTCSRSSSCTSSSSSKSSSRCSGSSGYDHSSNNCPSQQRSNNPQDTIRRQTWSCMGPFQRFLPLITLHDRCIVMVL